MKKLFSVVLTAIFFVYGVAWSQPSTPPSGWKIQSGSTRALYPFMPKAYTVATLPTGTTNDVVLATDCTAADDCSSGGGAHVKLVVKTATGWVILGDGSAAGAGDVGSVGDCTSGACLDGTSDGGTYIRLYDGDSHYTALVSSNVSGNVTITFPSATGTLQTNALAETYVWVGNAGGVAAAVDSTNWDKDSTNDYVTGGTDVALADGGTGASLSDPNADRIMFWDDSAGAVTWLTVGTGLDITATTLTASGSGDVTGVGDCESGACLDGTSDGGTYVRLYDGNSHYTQLSPGDSSGNLTFTFPTAAPAGNNAAVVMSTAGVLSTVEQGEIPGITGAQGDVLYYNGSSWVALAAGVNGQYLQTQGAAANPQWASTAISGDIETVGDVTSGAAFAGSGGNVLQFEGATANDYEITLTAADPGEDYTITLPATTGTVLLTDGTNTDNAILRSDGTGSLAQTSGVTIDDNADIAGARNVNITGDLTIQGDDLYMNTNTSGAVLVADGTNFNPVVMSGDVTIGTDGTTAIGADKIKDTMVDWGTGAGQVSLDDVTDGSSYQKIAAADVDASGHVNVLTDIDGTGAITVTGPTETRAKTVSDAADTLAELGQANTFTANNAFGNADTDTLTIRSLLVGGNSRALWIAGSAPTPSYATGTNELYVAGDIETAGTVYAASVSTGTGTDGQRRIDFTSNTTFTPSGNQMYFLNNVGKISENGTERDIVTPADSVTWTGTTHSFAGVTNLVLPTATPDANGEIGVNNTNETLLVYVNSALKTFDFSGDASGYVLKSNGTGTFTLQEDATAGAPTLDTVGDPTADSTIEFNAGEEVNWQFTGNYTTGSQFLIQQLTGNPSGGVLFEVRAADSDSVLARFGDGTNYLQVSQAGNVSHAGTSVFTAPRVATSIAPSAADGATLGTTALEFSDLYLADGGVIYFQNDQSVYLTPSAGTLTLTGAFVSTGAHTPSAANGAALGSATAEWSDLFLHDGAVIYGQADQSATLTSSASLWTANNFAVTGYLALGADPADAGAIRLPNAGYIYSEADAAGTDISVIGVDSSEVVQIGASGASGVTITPDVTVAGGDVILVSATAGARLTGGNGTLTIKGEGDGTDEDLTVNLNAANAATISSSTGVTDISFSALNLATTGTIQGAVKINSDANGMSSSEMTAAGMYGSLFVATGAGTWNLPAAAAGMSFCMLVPTAAAVVINPDDSDVLVYDGTADTAGHQISGGAANGDFICFIAVDATNWHSMGRRGTWTPGS